MDTSISDIGISESNLSPTPVIWNLSVESDNDIVSSSDDIRSGSESDTDILICGRVGKTPVTNSYYARVSLV